MSSNQSDRQRLNRRQFMQMTSLLALGLAYQKPTIETLHPNTALGKYGQADDGGHDGKDKHGGHDGKDKHGDHDGKDKHGDHGGHGGQGGQGGHRGGRP